ncbi:unnamed protein product [Prunus armeniaca]
MFTLEVHHGDYFVDGLYMGDNDYFGVVKLVKGNQLFVLYITKNSTPRPLNVQSLVFSAYGENAEDYEETAHGYDVDEENGQYDFLFVDKEEDFGEAEEEYVKLREAIKYYACKCARILRFVKNEPNRVRLVCDGNNDGDKANSIVKVIRVRGMLKVKRVKMNLKIVLGYFMLHILGNDPLFDEDFITNPNMSVPDFMSLVRKHYNIDVTRDQCYKAKNLANESIQGSIEEQYAKLTVVGFGRTFIKGQLLIAVGIDANNGMFSTAFAIVETERLGQAIEALKPDAEHRHCVRHLHNNFKVAGHGSLALKQRLWATARTILEARDKPRITIVERIRIYLMLRVARQKKKIGSMWHPMLPYHGCNIKATEEPNKSGRPKKARTRLVDEIPKGVTRLRSYGIDRQQYGKRQRQRQRKKERKRKKNEKRNQLSPSISRGTSIYKNNKTYTIRGGLTRTVATASQTAPIKVASQSTPTNVASQPAPCNFASQAGPSNFVS